MKRIPYLPILLLLGALLFAAGCDSVAEIEIENAAGNKFPIHVSLTGGVGPNSVKLEPGKRTVEKWPMKSSEPYTVRITLSRNGEVVEVITAERTGKSARVVLTEMGPNTFVAEWK